MNLRMILGDQLSHSMSSLADMDPKHDVILMCEVEEEATYVKHHQKKIAFLFSAMRHFAEELRSKGYQVRYTTLDDPDNGHSFTEEVKRAVADLNPSRVIVTEAGEYRVQAMLLKWKQRFSIPVEVRPDDRFLCTQDQFVKWAKSRKELRMEYFYRQMREQYDVLMEQGKPVGGQWNFDAMNRKAPSDPLSPPKPYQSNLDQITLDVIALVKERFQSHFGDIEPFYFAVTRRQALYALDKFIAERLSLFGDFQDAMLQGQPWLFHSHLSFYLNCGLLLPLECIQAAEKAYAEERAPLNAVEGFIRQILGWREYVRGIYWLKMPDYEQVNFLQSSRSLPALYWGQETHMNCLQQCVKETRENAYAHHIQRLMVLGNFALLAGLNPEQVNEWYMLVYADAYQWVELPNVTGMILFADGGLLASKPYAASGAYINKMSDYCKSCHYSVSKKTGADACPFNYLYWDFLIRNRTRLTDNPRLTMSYRVLDKMTSDKVSAIEQDSQRFFNRMKEGETI